MKCLTCHGLITNGNCGCSTGTQGAASVNIDTMLRDRDAEIARLKAEVERLTSDGYIPMLQAEVNRQERVITALEAALREYEERHDVDGLIKGHIEAATIDQRHEVGMLLAEIERLKAEVASQHEGFERERQALRRHIDRLRRALAAGPAALRGQVGVHMDWLEACARVVEAAQEAAMKEEP